MLLRTGLSSTTMNLKATQKHKKNHHSGYIKIA